MSGSPNSTEMRRALDDNSVGIFHERMLYDVVAFHLPSLTAIAVVFSCLPSRFGLLTEFAGAALLTDKARLQRMSEFKGRLFPAGPLPAMRERRQRHRWLVNKNSIERRR